MTVFVGQEKPSLEDLAHHGVLGMKWGKRKAATGSQIRQARRNLDGLQTAATVARFQAGQAPKGSKERARRDKLTARIEKDYDKSPDRVIAARMTKGEKIASVLLTGPAGLVAIGITSGVSRRIEKKQEDKAYDKKK